ncbi:hypothetical protein M426DRAFT_8058 [Hypoxylon sp. CI-4A]|nr:hypothetical protein M426DRAFT_8058 [Hypoxylon sp. CI-4A]
MAFFMPRNTKPLFYHYALSHWLQTVYIYRPSVTYPENVKPISVHFVTRISPVTPDLHLGLEQALAQGPKMSAADIQQASSSSKGPFVCRPDTGCTVQLGSGLMPIARSHTEKCKCILVDTKMDEEMHCVVKSAHDALEMGIMEAEKPSMAFAMILLGGTVSYD